VATFKKNKYSILKNVISKPIASFVSDYFLLKRQVCRTFIEDRYMSPFALEWGVFGDTQVRSYSVYGDCAMETLLEQVKPKMEKHLGFELVPTYAYARIYHRGDKLSRHKDRFSCEVSATMHLGGDGWPIYIDPTGTDNILRSSFSKERGYEVVLKKDPLPGVKINLNRGDMLIYSGCDLEHWREPLLKEKCLQVFFHYNIKGSKVAEKNKYDRRPHLGLPAVFCEKKEGVPTEPMTDFYYTND